MERGENLAAIITSLVAVIFSVIWLLWHLMKSRRVIAPLPPGPRGLPLVGYLPFLGSKLHIKFTDLAAAYGPIYKIWLGNKLCVVVSSPSLAEEVVRDQDKIFANRDIPIAARISTYGANDIAWSAYGPDWKKLRKIFVGKMMSNSSLDACYSLRKQEIKNTIRDVYNNKIGKPVNIGELAISTSIKVVQSILWGGTLESGEKGTNPGAAELRHLLGELMGLLGAPNISDFFPVLSRFDIQGVERRTKTIALWFEKIISSAIGQRRHLPAVKKEGIGNDDGRKDFLQFLLERVESKDSATSITMTELKALLVVK